MSIKDFLDLFYEHCAHITRFCIAHDISGHKSKMHMELCEFRTVASKIFLLHHQG